MSMNRNLTNTFFIILISFLPLTALAQTKVYKGIIRDKQSDEPIPFAAALLKYAQEGALSDSSGKFTIISNKAYD